MLNKEYKEKFAKMSSKSNANAEKVFDVIFRTVEPIEDSLGRDISEFTSFEILEFYKSLSTASVNRLMVINSALSRYCTYMLSLGMITDNQVHFREINKDAILKCVNMGMAKSKITTRKRLLEEIKYIENPSEQFIVLGIFEGLRGRQYDRMINLTADSFSNGHVKFDDGNGKEITMSVSNELVSYALDSANEYRSFSYTADYTIEAGMGFRSDDPRVIKDLKNVQANKDNVALFARRIYGKLVRLEKFYGTNIFEAQALKESGRIERFNKIIDEQEISPREAVDKFNADEDGVLRYGKIHDPLLYLKKFSDFIHQ